MTPGAMPGAAPALGEPESPTRLFSWVALIIFVFLSNPGGGVLSVWRQMPCLPALGLEGLIEDGCILFAWRYSGGATILGAASRPSPRSSGWEEFHEVSTLCAVAVGLAAAGVAKALLLMHLGVPATFTVSAVTGIVGFVWTRRRLVGLQAAEDGRRPTTR